MTRTVYKKIALALVSLFAVVTAGALMPSSVSAAGETFTWADYHTINVAGGETRAGNAPSGDPYNQFRLTVEEGGPGSQNLTGDQVALFRGVFLFNRGGDRGCTFGMALYLYRDTGNAQGRLWQPPPYGGQSASDPNAPPPCSDDPAIHAFLQTYHDTLVNIGGQRPGGGAAPETQDQKFVRVTILAPDPQSEAPSTVTITIKQGNQTVEELVVVREDSSGQLNYPPEETPVTYAGIFHLEPGEYQVCATYVITECEDFTKVKYEPLELSYGDLFEMPYQRAITARVELHTSRPCGSTLTQSGIQVTLKKPDGSTVAQVTPGATVEPMEGEDEALCDVNVVLGLSTRFEDMPPGVYEACATGASCVTFTKEEGVPGEVTLVIANEFVAPADQPVCSTGTGFAGVLAWVLCPFTRLIINAVEFIERNLIIPYLSVSPLQPGSAVYSLWANMRNIANIAFIIAFFTIIFSQATSIGLSNYGIKRLLPRLILVAVGANLSFFIVAFAIDMFNIFGGGVEDLVLAAINQSQTGETGGSEPTTAQNLFAITAVVGGVALGAIITTAGSVLGWLWGLVLAAFLILLIAILALVLRQMLIVMLVILSPLAFVAWLLPNTEKYFTKWRQMLIQLLLMYPMIVLLFAVGKILAALINSGDYQLASGEGASEQFAEAIKVLLGFFAMVAPLLFLPLTFVASGSLMSRVYNGMQRRATATKDTLGKFAGEKLKPRAQEAGLRMANSKNPFVRGIGQLSTKGTRKEFKLAQRQREIERAQKEHLAEEIAQNAAYRRGVAGIGGAGGAQRALAGAYSATEKAERENVQNLVALLNQRLRELRIDQKTFVDTHLKNYLLDPAANHQISGTSFDFNDHPELVKAAIHSAAMQGEVLTLEAARRQSNPDIVDQKVVDEAIEDNQGIIKGSGGYHLATNFELAAGRSQLSTNSAASELQMQQARLAQNWAGTPAQDIAGTQYSFVGAVEESLRNPTRRAQVLSALTTAQRDALKKTLGQIITSPSLSGRANNFDAIVKIHSYL